MVPSRREFSRELSFFFRGQFRGERGENWLDCRRIGGCLYNIASNFSAKTFTNKKIDTCVLESRFAYKFKIEGKLFAKKNYGARLGNEDVI